MAIIPVRQVRGFKWYYLVALVALLGIIGVIVWLYSQERLSLRFPSTGGKNDLPEAA